MPCFYFNFVEDDRVVDDEHGCEFETLDLAYLDAYRSMVRIGADLLLEQQDPSRQRIDIVDGAGVVLLSVPFDEVFCRRSSRFAGFPVGEGLRQQLEHSRRLGKDIRQACAEARASIATARATLRRVSPSDGPSASPGP